MRHTIRLALLAAMVTLSVFACGSDAVTVVPEVGPPLAADADGPTIYEARCASCHGTDLRGTEKGPSQLSIVYEPGHHGDDAYRSAIRNGAGGRRPIRAVPGQHHWGFGDMPAVADITDDQIETVITYIRAEQERLGFE